MATHEKPSAGERHAAETGAKGTDMLIKSIRSGFAWKRVDRFQRTYRMKDKGFARIIGVSDRTLTRLRNEEEPLDPVASDRFYRMEKVIQLAELVFENTEQAMRWLQRPQPGLGGSVPLDVLDTEPGSHAVERLLTQIEHAVLP